jgi:hypothetical protein
MVARPAFIRFCAFLRLRSLRRSASAVNAVADAAVDVASRNHTIARMLRLSAYRS